MHVHPENMDQAISLARQNFSNMDIIAPGIAKTHRVNGSQCCAKAAHARYLVSAAFRELTRETDSVDAQVIASRMMGRYIV